MITPHDPSSTEPTLDAAELEPLPPAVEAWLKTPLEAHIARWQREIAEGLRDATGRWIADPSQRHSRSAPNATR